MAFYRSQSANASDADSSSHEKDEDVFGSPTSIKASNRKHHSDSGRPVSPQRSLSPFSQTMRSMFSHHKPLLDNREVHKTSNRSQRRSSLDAKLLENNNEEKPVDSKSTIRSPKTRSLLTSFSFRKSKTNEKKAPVFFPGARARFIETPSEGDSKFCPHNGALVNLVGVTEDQAVVYWSGQHGSIPLNHFQLLQPVPTEPELARRQFLKFIEASPEMTLALCAVSEGEDNFSLAKPLAKLYFESENLVFLLESMIHKEIQDSVDAGILFRNSTVASSIVSALARISGKDYAFNLLQPFVLEIVKNSKNFEVQSDLKPEDVSKNGENLAKITIKFLEKLKASVSHCPLLIRIVCSLLLQEVGHRFPASSHQVVGGFFLLRFLLPVLISPEKHGLVGEIDDEKRRPLILLSKTLQNIANASSFQDIRLETLNQFVKDHVQEMKSVFENLSKYHTVDLDQKLPQSESLDLEDFDRIWLAFSKKLGDIGNYLQHSNPRGWRSTYEKLLVYMNQLGPLPPNLI